MRVFLFRALKSQSTKTRTITPKKFQSLIDLGESHTTEFKRSASSGLGKESCAFANATGGTILIGVEDDGKVVGLPNQNKVKSEAQSIARSAEPPIAIDIETIEDVLVVSVPAQQSIPYSFGGKFYLREGALSQQLGRSEIRDFFFKEGLIHFDETPCKRFNMFSDLTPEAWVLIGI